MLESGYIRMYRSILSWEWYDDANTMRVFLHLILTANWEQKKWHGSTIERGQRVYSRSKLAAELKMSEKNVRTAINHLISTGEVANQSTREYSIITIKNYDLYQQVASESANEGPTTGQRGANEGPQLKKDKESNKDKKDKYSAVFAAYAGEDTELLKALNDFAETRKVAKKPLSTERAAKMVIDKLDKLASDRETKIAIINQSVYKNWLSVFPLKDENSSGRQPKFERNLTFDIDEYERQSMNDTKGPV